ncbi:hypothetical protein KUV51_20220 [Tateyamaria omphalii]|uniref:hypothetical protein n=1 Tax=Tateyamaria omphalii TaxID=299262 RepID=UPI001C98F4F8|nr:hypothetical protein [Tateyamaria omphalii]MBY5935344.1 hypothetical protein [Tateyamaria omphalii]
MPKEKKSYDLELTITTQLDRPTIMPLVERAAVSTGLYISHIGGYSRVKYPNSVHWHFKRNRKEPGLIDATFWQEGTRFWLIVRHNEPQWVHDTAPALQAALQAEIDKLATPGQMTTLSA